MDTHAADRKNGNENPKHDDDSLRHNDHDPSQGYRLDIKRRRLTRNRIVKACTICRKLKTKCTFKEAQSVCERCQAMK